MSKIIFFAPLANRAGNFAVQNSDLIISLGLVDHQLLEGYAGMELLILERLANLLYLCLEAYPLDVIFLLVEQSLILERAPARIVWSPVILGELIAETTSLILIPARFAMEQTLEDLQRAMTSFLEQVVCLRVIHLVTIMILVIAPRNI